MLHLICRRGGSELVAGYFVEYSSMSFALFFLGEYANMILMSSMTVLFLGGWLPPLDIWPLNIIPGPLWFIIKIMLVLFVFLWVAATTPRYRYDQLMRLGWKIFTILVDLCCFDGWFLTSNRPFASCFIRLRRN